MNTHGRLQTTTPQNIELSMMEGKIRTKQVLARKRLSTISEWEEHEVAERQANAEVSETHQSRKASETLPGNQRQDSRTQSNTAENFPLFYARLIANVPLMRRLRGLHGKMLQSALLHIGKVDNQGVKEA